MSLIFVGTDSQSSIPALVKTVLPTLVDKSVTTNGVYDPADDNADGYSEFTVQVPIPTLTSLNVTPTTSQQSITPPTNTAYNDITVNAVTSSIDADIVSTNIKSGVNILGVNGSVVELQGEEIGITPTTSQQIITPTSPANGITKATVAAVTSTIDNNIIANNIRNGVSILGVSGDIIESNETTLNVTPTTSAQQHVPTGAYTGFNEVNVAAVTSSVDSNIAASNIKDGVTILGVTGEVVELKGEVRSESLTSTAGNTFTPSSSKNGITSITVTPNNESRTVTPSISQQTVGVNTGYSGNGTITVNPVTSSIDANITASNIKDGVSILGVTGSYGKLGTKNITINGTYNASSDSKDGYSSVTVAVPNGTEVGSGSTNGTYTPTSPNIGFSSFTVNVPAETMFGLTRAQLEGNITNGTIVYPGTNLILDLTEISSFPAYGMQYRFYGRTDLSEVKFSDSEYITISQNALMNAFTNCTNINCTSFSKIRTINSSGCWDMFKGCTNLSGSLGYIYFTNLTTIGSGGCYEMFYGCNKIKVVRFTALNSIDGFTGPLYYAFNNCTSLTDIYFNALTASSFGTSYTNHFYNMLYGCTGVKLHFKSNSSGLSTKIAGLSTYPNFGGTNTQILYDL